jgi:hypothetical protein
MRRPYRVGSQRVTDESPAQLEVRISGRERPERIAVTPGLSVQQELTRFLNRQGPYAQMWIKLESGEYVRYDLIASVCAPAS